ncbi:hypothetical protein ANN_13212 [Periplaneta americana]|uniref:Uncharacterized protein n=1 Tax=Periplaneta americana TaxID=6978 RepID=A0ABQ8TIS4_PERAM|nr:hypothetical protein ANN_13212 [Periplaneta americana]
MAGLCEGGNEPPGSLKASRGPHLWSNGQRVWPRNQVAGFDSRSGQVTWLRFSPGFSLNPIRANAGHSQIGTRTETVTKTKAAAENGLLSYENPNYHLDPARLDDALNSNTEQLYDDLYHELDAVCNLAATRATSKQAAEQQGSAGSGTPGRRGYAALDIGSMGVDVTTGPVTNLDTTNTDNHNNRHSVNLSTEIGFTDHQEVQGLATQGSVRRIDIIAIKNNSAYILDPTIRFETHADQPYEVDSEKKRIYEPTIPFYKDKYSLSRIDVIGLMVGARVGSIMNPLVDLVGIAMMSMRLIDPFVDKPWTSYSTW